MGEDRLLTLSMTDIGDQIVLCRRGAGFLCIVGCSASIQKIPVAHPSTPPSRDNQNYVQRLPGVPGGRKMRLYVIFFAYQSR